MGLDRIPVEVKLSRRIAFLTLSGIILYGSLSVADGQSEDVLLRTGMQALEAKDFSRALETFSALVKKNPSSTNIGYLAVAESGAGNLSQAIVDFRQAIKLGNDSVLTRYGLGTAYLRNHEPEAAARELRLVMVKDPNNAPARYALGVALLDLGRAREAIPDLEEARKRSPSNSQIWVSLTQAQFQAGNPQTAAKLADDATAAIPDNPQLSVALARLCLQYQQLEKARTLLENAVELQSNDPETKLLLANVCLHSGNPAETLEVLKGLPSGTGRPGEAMVLTAEARALTGDPVLARIDLSLALEG
jgi:predicted Zn-dependent protease